MTTPKRDSAGRRSRARIRRARDEEPTPSNALAVREPTALRRTGVGWDHDETPQEANATAGVTPDTSVPLTAQIMSLLSDPRINSVSAASGSRLLGHPRADVETALEALEQAGELQAVGGSNPRYVVTAETKHQLELMFRDAAEDLGETRALARVDAETSLALADEDEEPRLPVTAGLLSLFLPGTGQLLNGDVGRASLVFAVWSLALLTHLNPIWTFVALYAGAEAFFTAKIRGMERKLAIEQAQTGAGPGGPPRKPELNEA